MAYLTRDHRSDGKLAGIGRAAAGTGAGGGAKPPLGTSALRNICVTAEVPAAGIAQEGQDARE